MKIFTTKQIAEIDRFTIENEPIGEIDLMERASLQIVNWLVKHCSNEKTLKVFAGPGNNGGDAMVIARMMAEYDYMVEVFLLDFGIELKGAPLINWQRLEQQNKVTLQKLHSEKEIPALAETNIVIDGLFGSGITRPIEGLAAAIVCNINAADSTVIAVDIPSGLMGEDNNSNNLRHIIRANHTITLQFPKISFFFAENEQFIGTFEILPIGLHPDGIRKIESPFYFIEKSEIAAIVPDRSKFAHKGTTGHALLIAGSYGKMGAAILASGGCLRAGVGLLTTHIPRLGYDIIQSCVPEAMASIDRSDLMFTEFPDLDNFNAVGVGPGLDTKKNTQRALFLLLEKSKKPLVIDADALNIIASDKKMLRIIPEKSILTPHPGEFKRLVGESSNSYERLTKQIEFAKKYRLIVVLKGAFTSVAMPDGKVYFNSTGNPGMATAGSGDVLTGIILGLLAQGINPEQAALTGVYIHGLAGDVAKIESSEYSIIASDIINSLGKAFYEIKS